MDLFTNCILKYLLWYVSVMSVLEKDGVVYVKAGTTVAYGLLDPLKVGIK